MSDVIARQPSAQDVINAGITGMNRVAKTMPAGTKIYALSTFEVTYGNKHVLFPSTSVVFSDARGVHVVDRTGHNPQRDFPIGTGVKPFAAVGYSFVKPGEDDSRFAHNAAFTLVRVVR